MMTDPIADFLTQIRNAYAAEKHTVRVPHSQIKEQIAHVLRSEQYIGDIKVEKKDDIKKDLVVSLVYKQKRPVMEDIIRVSKPGRRVYVDKDHIPTVLQGMGVVILSTSEGIMSGKEAKKKGIGGEVVCKLW